MEKEKLSIIKQDEEVFDEKVEELNVVKEDVIVVNFHTLGGTYILSDGETLKLPLLLVALVVHFKDKVYIWQMLEDLDRIKRYVDELKFQKQTIQTWQDFIIKTNSIKAGYKMYYDETVKFINKMEFVNLITGQQVKALVPSGMPTAYIDLITDNCAHLETRVTSSIVAQKLKKPYERVYFSSTEKNEIANLAVSLTNTLKKTLTRYGDLVYLHEDVQKFLAQFEADSKRVLADPSKARKGHGR